LVGSNFVLKVLVLHARVYTFTCETMLAHINLSLVLRDSSMISARIQTFYEQVLSLKDSLTVLSLSVSGDKPYWFTQYKCKGWSLCSQLVQSSKRNYWFQLFSQLYKKSR